MDPASAGRPRTLRDPGAALIAVEREVWTLEGMLLAEADAALRTPAAKHALGDPHTLRFSDSAEGRARAFLRTIRSPEVRDRAKAFLASINRTTSTMIANVVAQTGLAPEDVLMDYLTYDALFDLAIMRYGYKRWKAGAYAGESKALADSFFSLVPEAPSAKRGINVVAADASSIEISVFGARVQANVKHATVRELPGVGNLGVVEWTSNYEQLRGGIRGADVTQHTSIEELEREGGAFLVNYANELDEYLTWNSTNPWAVVLYLVSADEVADMYAGVAGAGGFQASAGAKVENLASLPSEGVIGTKAKGLAIKVLSARPRPRLGAMSPRRGQFLVVTVEVSSTLVESLRAPAEWFRLATATTEFPELGVARPGIAPAVLPTAPRGASLLGVPYSSIAPGKATTFVLVYDVPADVKAAALLLGSNELALKVATP